VALVPGLQDQSSNGLKPFANQKGQASSSRCPAFFIHFWAYPRWSQLLCFFGTDTYPRSFYSQSLFEVFRDIPLLSQFVTSGQNIHQDLLAILTYKPGILRNELATGQFHQ
jgi:hypothetical protein